jgi:hypothetical protein
MDTDAHGSNKEIIRITDISFLRKLQRFSATAADSAGYSRTGYQSQTQPS